jgi:outer membrane protein
MRRLILVLPLLFAVPARAQAVKIAFVDIQRAYQEVDEGKSVRSRLQQELAQRRTELDQRRANLEKMKADYDKQAPVLSDDAKRKRQEELQKAFLDAQQCAQHMQEELSGKEQEAMMGINKRMAQIVNEIVDRENFNYVIDKAALLYAPPSADITNEVVRRYNERFGNGSGRQGAPAKQGGDKKAAAAPKK